ncbi:CDC27 family protein [Edwardsiella anguillarum]|uniref:CDC27 family protein n=1 Tax=Edwardsiella anguillarum TaxID=1821960 RepID=UPI0024B7303F|nr:CDC27 family protein [Edwardsiella anguillarum]WHP81113.1 tetratricopeptide repeat protein [Edwardsiella anguillarum]WHQ18614.1 tetratricopeptide repeat protein [Edwardsiella anguillarum]WHQ22155.1 tetratricopeptide repeat protein [Edwardsiella anguillarum]WHQ25678.1 tetratricopeptide repeat protein [Edwardsiella anguillarum]WHQ29201.1 tetratricopeptide repeat protein [Edwardsiella anguillarum]
MTSASLSAQAENVARRCLALLEGKETQRPLSGASQDEMEASYARGCQALNDGDIHEATATFAFLSLQQPLERRFTFAFACVLLQQQEYHQALTLFSYSLALQANDPFTPFHMAECLFALREPDAAMDALDATIALCYGQADANPRYTPLRQRAQDLLDTLNQP